MNKKFGISDWESDCEDYERDFSLKRIKTGVEDTVPRASFTFPRFDNKSTQDKCCPNTELIKKCEFMILHGNPHAKKYFRDLLNHLQKGEISLY